MIPHHKLKQSVRTKVIFRDNHTCQICGYRPPLHNICEYNVSINKMIELKWNPNPYYQRRDFILSNPCAVPVVEIDFHQNPFDKFFIWYFDEGLEVDHLVPVSKGGRDHPSNLQTLCHDCHIKKTRFDRSQSFQMYDKIGCEPVIV